jgi:RsiW-degrading membrane proteinase PrsW (M82 family)
MTYNVCCVCNSPVDEGAKMLGGRYYCDVHFAKVARHRKSLWWTSIVEVAALVIFVILVALVATVLPESLEGPPLIIAGLAMALVPALIWLLFFYQQDSLEPEPKAYVLGVFILGALLANSIALPVIKDLFQTQNWLYDSVWTHILGSILIIGFTQEFLKYAAVRYTIYPTAEFDERGDGVVYATAAGLGFATMINLHYVIDNHGVALGVGAIRIAVTALAHASFAGVMGYFLGQAKFEDKPVWYLPGGLTLAAVLNGLFFYVQDVATTRGLSFNPWNGMVLAVIIALGTFGIVFWLIRRANAETLALGQASSEMQTSE